MIPCRHVVRSLYEFWISESESKSYIERDSWTIGADICGQWTGQFIKDQPLLPFLVRLHSKLYRLTYDQIFQFIFQLRIEYASLRD